MADDTSPKKQETEAFQKQAEEIRTALANGNAFVEGSAYTDSLATFTIEEAMDRNIERLTGKPPFRPNELDRLLTVKNRVLNAVEKAKSIRPEDFLKADESTNVNTRR